MRRSGARNAIGRCLQFSSIRASVSYHMNSRRSDIARADLVSPDRYVMFRCVARSQTTCFCPPFQRHRALRLALRSWRRVLGGNRRRQFGLLLAADGGGGALSAVVRSNKPLVPFLAPGRQHGYCFYWLGHARPGLLSRTVWAVNACWSGNHSHPRCYTRSAPGCGLIAGYLAAGGMNSYRSLPMCSCRSP